VPVLPLPLESYAIFPEPSSNFQYPINPRLFTGDLRTAEAFTVFAPPFAGIDGQKTEIFASAYNPR
jgi:hypothetical protein